MRVYTAKNSAIAINDFGEVADISGVNYTILQKELEYRRKIAGKGKREATLLAEIVNSWEREALQWQSPGAA
jgi:hypothetical protein